MKTRPSRLSRCAVRWVLAGVTACTPREAAKTDGPPSHTVTATSQPTAIPSATGAAASAVPALAPPIRIAASGSVDVIDLHVDTPWKVHFKGRKLSLPEGHATVPMLKQGSYAAIVFPIYIPDYINDGHPRIADADEILATIEKLVAHHDDMVAVRNGPVPDDRIGVFVAIEGAGAFAEDIEQIDRFIERGVRLVGPVHANDNALASSATGKKGGFGLTELGEAFCRRVYAAGALVDVSHMSDAAFADLAVIAREAKAPIVATHSNARALAGHKRNLTDEQLKQIGASNGVTGLNLHRTFVSTGRIQPAGAEAAMDQVVAQVRHMVDTAGVDHVAIGSDFDGGNPVAALEDASRLPALAEALLASGMSDGDVRKIFALNALRVLSWRPDKR
jgi:membrane dipeptidase